jgi:hypothetical protein
MLGPTLARKSFAYALSPKAGEQVLYVHGGISSDGSHSGRIFDGQFWALDLSHYNGESVNMFWESLPGYDNDGKNAVSVYKEAAAYGHGIGVNDDGSQVYVLHPAASGILVRNYDVAQRSWSPVPSTSSGPPGDLQYFSYAAVSDSDRRNALLFLHGGRANEHAKSTLWRFSTADGTWKQLGKDFGPQAHGRISYYRGMLIHSGTDSNTGAALFQQYNIETGLTSMIVSPNSDFAAPARQHHSMGIDQATGQVYLHGGIAADSGLWTVKVRGGTIVRGDYNNCSGNKKSKVDAIANNVNAQTNARCTAQRSRQEERMQMFLGEFMCKDQTSVSVSVSPQRSCLQNYLKDGTMDWNAFKITLNSELKRQGGQWVCPAKEIAMAWTDVDFAAFKAKLDGTQFGKAVINAIDLVCPTRQGRRLGDTMWGLTSNTSTSLWTNDNGLWSQDLWEDHKGTQMSQAANNDVNGQGSCDKGELDPIIAVCFHRDSTVLVPTSNGQFQIRLMQDLRQETRLW